MTKRLPVTFITRLIGGGFLNLLPMAAYVLSILVVLIIYLTEETKPANADLMTQFMIVISAITFSYYLYIYLRLGVFLTEKDFIERRFLRTYHVPLKDIETVELSSYVTSYAAHNTIELLKTRISAENPSRTRKIRGIFEAMLFIRIGEPNDSHTIRYTQYMFNRSKNWALVDDLISSIKVHSPNVTIISHDDIKGSGYKVWKNYTSNSESH